MTATAAAAPVTPDRTGRPPRIDGVDATRTLAILGMLVAHLSGVAADRWGFLHWTNGYSAGGFAVLAGVSLGLTRRLAEPGWRAWPPQVVRSALLFALGVALHEISFGPLIILCVYAVLFLVAMPFRRLSGRALMAVGLGLTVVAPVVSLALRRTSWLDGVEPRYDVSWDLLTGPDAVAATTRTLVLDGVYPLLTWFPLALVGWGACRSGLLDPARWRRLAMATGALLVAGFALSAGVEQLTRSRAELLEVEADTVLDELGVDPAGGPFAIEVDGERIEIDPTDAEQVEQWYAPPVDNGFGVPRFQDWKVLLTAGHHTGTTFEQWQILGVTATSLLAFSLLARVAGGLVRFLGWPGRIALTVYSAHLVVGWYLDRDGAWLDWGPVARAGLLAAFVVGSFLLGLVFRNRRGPLEWILHLATRLTAGAVARVPARRGSTARGERRGRARG